MRIVTPSAYLRGGVKRKPPREPIKKSQWGGLIVDKFFKAEFVETVQYLRMYT